MRYIEVIEIQSRSSTRSPSIRISIPDAQSPAQWNKTSIVPVSSAVDSTALESNTSRMRVWMAGFSDRRASRACPLMSVAQTIAPSFAKRSAVARPMPWPAADQGDFPIQSRHVILPFQQLTSEFQTDKTQSPIREQYSGTPATIRLLRKSAPASCPSACLRLPPAVVMYMSV